MLHYFHDALFPCCTLFVQQFFRVSLFSLCTIFVLHFFMLRFFMVHSFHVSIFPYWTIFIFRYFFCFSCFLRVAPFPCCCFSVFLYSHAAYLRWLFSCCAVSILHSFYVQCHAWIIRKPRSDCIFFMCCVKCVIKWFY